MSTNRIQLTQGVAKSLTINLVDENGEALTSAALEDAVGTFIMRTAPDAGLNTLFFATPDPTHLVFVGSALQLSFINSDTASLPLGTYSYKLQITKGDGSTYDVVPWTPAYISLGGTDQPQPPVFDNTVMVNENYGGITDALRYMSPGGVPIESAHIAIYFKSDYDAANLTTPVGVTTTNAYGRWSTPVLVQPGFSYVVSFFKPNEYGPDVQTITA